jgi:hypothetical protein
MRPGITNAFTPRSTFLVIGSICLSLVLLDRLLTDRIPPEALTRTRMSGIETRMRSYIASHGRPPSKLSELPQRPNYDDSVVDAWGQPIQYDRNADGSVTLISRGESPRHYVQHCFTLFP